MAHEHHHEHHHEEGSPRHAIVKIVVAAVLLAAAIVVEKKTEWATWQYLLLYLVPYLLVGLDTLKEAAEALAHGEALDENFLMSVATLGALAIGFLPGAETQFPEAVFVMLFFQVGALSSSSTTSAASTFSPTSPSVPLSPKTSWPKKRKSSWTKLIPT